MSSKINNFTANLIHSITLVFTVGFIISIASSTKDSLKWTFLILLSISTVYYAILCFFLSREKDTGVDFYFQSSSEVIISGENIILSSFNIFNSATNLHFKHINSYLYGGYISEFFSCLIVSYTATSFAIKISGDIDVFLGSICYDVLEFIENCLGALLIGFTILGNGYLKKNNFFAYFASFKMTMISLLTGFCGRLVGILEFISTQTSIDVKIFQPLLIIANLFLILQIAFSEIYLYKDRTDIVLHHGASTVTLETHSYNSSVTTDKKTSDFFFNARKPKNHQPKDLYFVYGKAEDNGVDDTYYLRTTPNSVDDT